MLYLIIGSVLASLFLFILHFFGLRLRQKLEFSHIQFLAALNAQTRSVRKINNLLLLLLRILFVLAALAAFISFFLTSKSDLAVADKGSIKVIVDNTWSMQSGFKGERVVKSFQAARDAERLTETWLLNNGEKNAGEGKASSGRESKISLALPIEDFLKSESGSNSKALPTYVLSDFQKSTFSENVLTDISKSKNAVLIPYASAGPNFFIDSVWLSEPVILPQSTISLNVRLAGSLQKENHQVAVQLKEQNELLGTSQVLLESGQKRIIIFQIRADKAEDRQLTIEVEDATNAFDNQFFVILPKPSEVQFKVLPALPNKHPVIQAFKEEPAFNFSSTGNKVNSLWVYEVPESGRNIGNIDELKQWLNGGGHLLVLPSQGNQQPLLDFLSKVGLKGVREEVKGIGEKPMKQPDLSDSYFRPIFEKEVKNVKMPTAEPVLTWQSAFHTILRFTDNTPFLSTFKVANGSVHLFAAPINKISPFAAHPLFVPVMYQLALQSTSARTLSYEPTEGGISLPAPLPQQAKEPYKLSGFSQTWFPQQQVIQNQLQLTLPEELSQPGFYDLIRGEQALGKLAINIPRAESKLESFSATELQNFMRERNSGVKVLVLNDRNPLEKQLQSEERPNALWKYCLILCLLCLVIEAVILSAKKRGSLI